MLWRNPAPQHPLARQPLALKSPPAPPQTQRSRLHPSQPCPQPQPCWVGDPWVSVGPPRCPSFAAGPGRGGDGPQQAAKTLQSHSHRGSAAATTTWLNRKLGHIGMLPSPISPQEGVLTWQDLHIQPECQVLQEIHVQKDFRVSEGVPPWMEEAHVCPCFRLLAFPACPQGRKAAGLEGEGDRG